ncbi:hypothetical protein ACJJTC_016927 [Scirpophaga incertulas]
MTDRQKREQRRKWRNNSRKYLNKLKDKRKLESVLLENSPPSSETEEILNTERDIDSTERDPLMDIEKKSDTSLNTDKIPNINMAHLEPVLNMVQKSLPNLDAIHFVIGFSL